MVVLRVRVVRTGGEMSTLGPRWGCFAVVGVGRLISTGDFDPHAAHTRDATESNDTSANGGKLRDRVSDVHGSSSPKLLEGVIVSIDISQYDDFTRWTEKSKKIVMYRSVTLP